MNVMSYYGRYITFPYAYRDTLHCVDNNAVRECHTTIEYRCILPLSPSSYL